MYNIKFKFFCPKINDIISLKGEIMKKILSLVLVLGILLVVSGCTTSKSLTYNVETGDKIKVELNTTKGYDIDSDLPWTISKDEENLSKGKFLTLEGYEYYMGFIEDGSVEVIDSGVKDNIEWILYKTNNEYNYLIKVSGSNTGILVGNNISLESAKECFERLTFELE